MPKHTYISRREAAKSLDVSLRTLDRYIRKKNIRKKRSGRNLLLVQEDILSLKKHGPVESEVLSYQEDHKSQEVHNSVVPSETGSDVVRTFIDEYRRQLTEKDQKIELLQYRVGQLETKLKEAVPLLEHKETFSKNEQKMHHQELKIKTLEMKYKMASMAKNIYIIVLLVFLIGISFSWLLISQ